MYISPVSAEYITLGALRPSIGGLAPEDAGKFLNFQLPRNPRCRRQPRDADNISAHDARNILEGDRPRAPRNSLSGLPTCCEVPLRRQPPGTSEHLGVSQDVSREQRLSLPSGCGKRRGLERQSLSSAGGLQAAGSRSFLPPESS